MGQAQVECFTCIFSGYARGSLRHRQEIMSISRRGRGHTTTSPEHGSVCLSRRHSACSFLLLL